MSVPSPFSLRRAARALGRAFRLASRGASMSLFQLRDGDGRLRIHLDSRGRAVTALLAFAVPICFFHTARASGTVEYNRDIRPILAENCFACHGPDSARGRPTCGSTVARPPSRSGAITPGDPEASELIARINTDQSQGGHASAVAAQDAHAAAEGDPRAMGRSRAPSINCTGRSSRRHDQPLPRVKDETGFATPIDRFILARLEEQGPAARPRGRPTHAGPAAEPRSDGPASVARRTSRRSCNDASPDAYAKLVDRLLESPRLGRAPRTVLAGRGALRRHARLPLRQLPRDVDLSRLGHRRVQPQHALRPVHHRAACRRPLAQPHASSSRSPRASTAAT